MDQRNRVIPFLQSELQTSPVLPIIDETGLLFMVGGVLAVTIVVVVCVTVVIKGDPKLLAGLTSPSTLHIITVIFAIFTVAVLALEGILSGEVVANVLSGIVGYVLGSLKSTSTGSSAGE
jgi:hypothetical protein